MLEVAVQVCPWCGCRGQFKYHGTYNKYLFDKLLEIFRVRCLCKRTHALMPSFSVPWRSLGMAELEAWLKRREDGLSRREAAQGLPTQVDWLRTGSRLEHVMRRMEQILKAALPAACLHAGHGLALLAAFAGTTEHVLTTINRRCLAAGVAPLYFARIGGIDFGAGKSGIRLSHDPATPQTGKAVPDSS
jgi:hypothetical protein